MINLKQEEIGKALIQLVNVRYLIDDGYHNKELGELIKVSNTLFEELSDANKIKFQIWIDKKLRRMSLINFRLFSLLYFAWLTGNHPLESRGKHFKNNSRNKHGVL